MRSAPRGTTASTRGRRGGLLLSALLVLLGLAGLVWRWTGGHWLIIASASMGRAAPVGSLVLTRPARVGAIRVGELVSYHPPAAPAETITHRVVSVDAAGLLHTQGDLNAAVDPWALGDHDLLGRVVSIWWGWGWLVKALPLLVVGTVVVWWATRWWASAHWRAPLRVLGFTAVFSVAAFLLKPFVNMTLLSTSSDTDGTHVALVSTGMLPIRISAASGGHLDLVDGQAGILTTQLADRAHGVNLSSAVHLSLWGWILLVLVWLLPLFLGLWLGRPAGDDPAADDTPGGDALGDGTTGPEGAAPDGYPAADPGLLTHLTTNPSRRRPVRWRRRAAPALAAVTLAAAAAVGGAPATSAAFAAKLTNTTDTATAASYFTCAAAAASVGSTNTIFTYPLGDATVTSGSTAADVGGNSRAGTYSGPFSTTTSRPCTRDTTTTAVTLAPTSLVSSYVYSSYKTTVVNTFTEIVWFKTTTTTGGRLIGWSTAQTGQSSVYDRHIWMTNAGLLVFGVYPGAVKTVNSTSSYNDGAWHQAAATLSSAGMALYVDGALVASDPSTVSGENSGGTVGGTGVEQGYWRVGYDNLANWGTSTPTTYYWTGSLAWASVFTTALSAAQIRSFYQAGT